MGIQELKYTEEHLIWPVCFLGFTDEIPSEHRSYYKKINVRMIILLRDSNRSGSSRVNLWVFSFAVIQ